MLISRGVPVTLRKHVDRRVFITLELLHVPGFQGGVSEGIFPDVVSTFHTEEGATRFAAIRGYLSTACKQGNRCSQYCDRSSKGSRGNRSHNRPRVSPEGDGDGR